MNHSRPGGQSFCMCSCLSITTQRARGALDGLQCTYSISSASHLAEVLTLQRGTSGGGGETMMFQESPKMWVDRIKNSGETDKYVLRLMKAENSRIWFWWMTLHLNLFPITFQGTVWGRWASTPCLSLSVVCLSVMNLIPSCSPLGFHANVCYVQAEKMCVLSVAGSGGRNHINCLRSATVANIILTATISQYAMLWILLVLEYLFRLCCSLF